MDQMNILKRAWKILWSYRTLWIFGILIALTSSGGSSGSSGSNSNWSMDSRDFDWRLGDFGRWLEELGRQVEAFFTPERLASLIGIGIALVCLAVLVGLALTAVRYVSQAALIRMVDGYETTGEKVSFRQGWRMGWSRAAWRLWLIDLLIFLPVFALVIGMFGCAALPVLLSVFSGNDPTPAGIISTVGLAFLVIFVLIVIGAVISLFSEIIHRVCVLENRGAVDSIRTGWNLVKRNFKDVFILWLVLLGVGVALLVLFIPVVILLIALGVALGGGLGAGLFFLVQSLATTTAGWITAIVVGGLLFLLVLSVPLLFLSGLKETFFSTCWTLAYRELDRPEELETAVIVPPAPPELPAVG